MYSQSNNMNGFVANSSKPVHKPRRRIDRTYGGIRVTCEELCGRLTPCGNKYCSNNPEYNRNRKKGK